MLHHLVILKTIYSLIRLVLKSKIDWLITDKHANEIMSINQSPYYKVIFSWQ